MKGFVDFFETLIPREITIYVLPGSLVLAAVLCNSKLYIHHINCQLQSAKIVAVFDKLICNANTATYVYVFIGIAWIAIAYTIGLTIGGIKEGILYKPIKCLGKWGKFCCDNLLSWFSHFLQWVIYLFTPNKKKSKKKRASQFGALAILNEPETLGIRLLLMIILQNWDAPKKKGQEGKKEQENKEDIETSSFYISLHQERMYRREIERYGIFANALENLAIAMLIVILLIHLNQVNLLFPPQTDKVLVTRFFLLLVLFLPIGSQGFRELQKNRIKYLKKAMDLEAVYFIR